MRPCSAAHVIRGGTRLRICDAVKLMDPGEQRDGALVVSIGRWDERALEEAYRRHGGAVYGLARRVLRDDALAEEITQEIFVRLWNEPERFDPERGSLRAFLLAQSHRRAVDVVRSEEARKKREQREAESTIADDDGLDREVFDLNMAENVKDALAGLPDRERVPIELAYYGGRTYREVAAELDTPEGTIKSRIRSGLAKLRDTLTEAGVTV